MNKELLKRKSLLIVVDMVNGFIREGKMHDKGIEVIIDEIVKLINLYKKENKEVVFIKEAHTKDSGEFNNYPEHCIKGTSEAELVDELKLYEKEYRVFEKDTTNALLEDIFREYINLNDELEEIIITGCCTDICVMELALMLQKYFYKIKRNTEIVLLMNAMETYHISNIHDRNEYNEIAYKIMNNAGIKIFDKLGGKQYGKK